MSQSMVQQIHFPLRGEWRTLCPPGHHRLAFDFVQVDQRGQTCDQGRVKSLLGTTASSRFYCWEQPVFSPISGTVLRCANDWSDHLSNGPISTIQRWYYARYRFKPELRDGVLDIRPNAGNFIMIESNEGYIVFLAHLRQGSLKVMPGQAVVVGDELAAVGNSGNSTAPHLHLNLFDQMVDPFSAEVLPFVFAELEVRDPSGAWCQRQEVVPTLDALVRVS